MIINIEKNYTNSNRSINTILFIEEFYYKSSLFYIKKMKCKLVLSLLLLVFSCSVSAQELTLSLSQHPNKEAIILAVHGVRKDTLGIILLNQNGKGSFAFKTKQAQAGLVNLTIRDKAYLSYDFVLSPIESPTLICDMEYVYAQNTKIFNSPENDCLNRWFDNTVQYKQKINSNQELSKLYQPEDMFFKNLATEKQLLEKQLQKLTDTIKQSTLFAAKYMQFKLAQEEKLVKVWESNEQRTKAKNYFNQIDFEALYGSSLWYPIINSCMEAYVKDGIYYQTFGSDVVSNLKRIKNIKVYEDLIDATIAVTEKFSWNTDQDVIVDFIIKDHRIKNPNLKLQKIIDSHNLFTGKKAPNLLITNPFGINQKTTVLKTSGFKSKYSLLLFYQSECGHCKIAIEGLIENYQGLVQKGIKIISIAGDNDQENYKTNAAHFPWLEKYCDVNGMNGFNFKNYAVIGTPTFYLLNSKGVIIEKMATINQTDFVHLKFSALGK